MPRLKKPGGKRSAYWWSEEIAEIRRECLKRCREATRARKKRGSREITTTDEQYKQLRKKLTKTIRKSKAQKWHHHTVEVNNDPWGLGYRIVTWKLGALSLGGTMEPAMVENIINALFPTHPVRQDDTIEVPDEEIPLFSMEELEAALKGLQNRKAPGPDGIPAEALKAVARTSLQVLVSQGKGDPNTPSAYRPLCMLNTTGKLLEKLLKPRLETAIQEAGDLSPQCRRSWKPCAPCNAVTTILGRLSSWQRWT